MRKFCNLIGLEQSVVFQLNLKLLPTCENYKTFTGSEKQIIAWFVRDIWHKILYS